MAILENNESLWYKKDNILDFEYTENTCYDDQLDFGVLIGFVDTIKMSHIKRSTGIIIGWQCYLFRFCQLLFVSDVVPITKSEVFVQKPDGVV